MKVSAEKIENQQVVLTIEVVAAELDKAEERACKRLANQVSIPGFPFESASRRLSPLLMSSFEPVVRRS